MKPVMYAIDQDRVNIDDLLCARPGGIVRVDGSPHNAIFAIPLGATFLQSWDCGYCDTVMSWDTKDNAPRKCTSCGAPRQRAE